VRPEVLLLLPSVALVGGMLGLPLVWLARLSFMRWEAGGGFYVADSLTGEHYARILSDPYFWAVGGATLRLGMAVTLATMALAVPLAIWIYRARPAVGQAAQAAVLLPKLAGPLVAIYGLLALLASTGLVNRMLVASGLVGEPLPIFASLAAVVCGEVLIVAPYPVLILLSALRGVDPRLEEAAHGLGAPPWRAFLEVPGRLVLPGALLATLVTAIWALGAFAAPLLLGNPELYPLGIEIYSTTFEQANWPLGAALAVANLVVVGLVAVVGLGLRRRLEVWCLGG
jgi:ABC-type spermidine/putrescine transport system permease subunit I